MSGICGFIRQNFLTDSKQLLQRMLAAISHRGVGVGNALVEPPLALGHQPLLAHDPATAARQPAVSDDGKLVISFDGSIYNRDELTGQYIKNLRAASADAEIVLALWAALGVDCIELLNGVFAFALYDRCRNELYCVRDRFGVKPLYYWFDKGDFAFASEAKALLQDVRCRSNVDCQALSDYLSFGYITGKKTVFSGIKKLRPAHYLRVTEGTIRELRYWNLFEQTRSMTEAAADREILPLLEAAVKLRLNQTEPPGLFLSAGIDSAAIAALAVRQGSKPATFTMGFTESAFDESLAAAELAVTLGLPNQAEYFASPTLADLQQMVSFFDQPFADTSTLPFFQLCRHTRQSVSTVLCGDGGDEIFAGYETCRADRFALTGYRSVPGWSQLLRLGNWLVDYIPADRGKVSMRYKIRQFCEFAHLPPPQSHCSWRLLFTEAEKQQLLAPQINQQLQNYQAYANFAELYSQASHLPMLQQHALIDLQTWLPDDILYKADQASMAHALSLLVPFLDHRLVAAAFSLPEQHKFSLIKTKTLLRQKLAAILPKAVTNRKKAGFSSPVAGWLDAHLASPFLDAVHSRQFKEFFPQTGQILQFCQEHRERRRDHGYRLWALFMFALWQQQWARPTQ